MIRFRFRIENTLICLLFFTVELVANNIASHLDDSSNVSLIAKIPIQTCQSVYVENNIAFIGTDSLLIIMEVSDPQQPQTIGTCFIPSPAMEVIIKDTLAFILSREKGLRIISISDYQNPQEINHFTAGQDTVLFLDTFIKDSLAYIADRVSGIRIVDIHDINNITEITVISNNSFPTNGSYVRPTALSVKDNYCYVGIYWWDEDPFADLFLVDLTDPLNPIITNRYAIGEEIEYITIENDYLYLLDYAWGFYVFDISSPGGIPVLQSNILTYSNWHDGLFIRGNHAYISPGISGEQLIVIDISDKTNPQQVGYFVGNRTKGSIFVDDQFIYLCSPTDSLYVLKFQEPVSINETDSNPYSLYNSLYQNFPNPFNPSTTIHYEIKAKIQVDLSVFDITGRHIKTLISQIQNPGKYSVAFDGSDLSSGIYLYKLSIGKFEESRKMLLIR